MLALHLCLLLDAADALMSDNTPAAREGATRMLAEVGRVLKPAGKFLCVTLLQVR